MHIGSQHKPAAASTSEAGFPFAAISTVAVWGMDEGRLLYTLARHASAVNDLAFIPDSSLLATGGFGGVVKLWDVTTGNERYTLPSLVETVVTIRFTPDGENMITGGDALRVCGVETGTELVTLSDGRSHFDLSPDGRYLYAGHFNDGVVRVYALILEDLVEVARERLTRWWTPEECRQYQHQETCPER